jgi:antitoxin component YwqK of YwqJK toxin-antitoxin module
MQKLPIALSLFFCFSCKQKLLRNLYKGKEIIVAKNYIPQNSKNIFIGDEIVYVKNKVYSGFIYTLCPNNKDTFLIDEYSDGLLNGISKKWYANHQLMEERNYSAGKKKGRQISYWENVNKKFEFVAKDDAYEGELKEWTYEGKLIHLANYVNGQEEGTQKLWYDNGKIRANYVMKNGKRYGLLGTKNCKNVSDSIYMLR